LILRARVVGRLDKSTCHLWLHFLLIPTRDQIEILVVSATKRKVILNGNGKVVGAHSLTYQEQSADIFEAVRQKLSMSSFVSFF